MNFNTYLEDIYLEGEATKEATKLGNNVINYIKSFPKDEYNLRGMVGDVINDLIGSWSKGEPAISRAKRFFQRIANKSFLKEMSAETANTKTIKGYILILALLRGLSDEEFSEASSAGFDFEGFVAGALSKDPKKSKNVKEKIAEDIFYKYKEEELYVQVKLKQDLKVNIGKQSVIKFFRENSFDKSKENLNKNMWVIFGYKQGNTLTIYFGDATEKLKEYYIINSKIFDEYVAKEGKINGAKIYKFNEEITNLDNVSSYTIDISLQTNELSKAVMDKVFNLFNSANDFVKDLNMFFTKGKIKYQRVEKKYNKVGKEMKKAGIGGKDPEYNI